MGVTIGDLGDDDDEEWGGKGALVNEGKCWNKRGFLTQQLTNFPWITTSF